jgi:hypothetical protein
MPWPIHTRSLARYNGPDSCSREKGGAGQQPQDARQMLDLCTLPSSSAVDRPATACVHVSHVLANFPRRLVDAAFSMMVSRRASHGILIKDPSIKTNRPISCLDTHRHKILDGSRKKTVPTLSDAAPRSSRPFPESELVLGLVVARFHYSHGIKPSPRPKPPSTSAAPHAIARTHQHPPAAFSRRRETPRCVRGWCADRRSWAPRRHVSGARGSRAEPLQLAMRKTQDASHSFPRCHQTTAFDSAFGGRESRLVRIAEAGSASMRLDVGWRFAAAPLPIDGAQPNPSARHLTCYRGIGSCGSSELSDNFCVWPLYETAPSSTNAQAFLLEPSIATNTHQCRL